jgi:hypothetical protein
MMPIGTDALDLLDRLLEAAYVNGVLVAGFLDHATMGLSPYLLFPLIGVLVGGLADLLLRGLGSSAGSIGNAAGRYLLGGLIGLCVSGLWSYAAVASGG